jgi:PXPV repeat-containing protein
VRPVGTIAAVEAKGLNSMKTFRFLAGALAALTVTASLAAANPAAARDRLSPGAAAAIGVLGGLAVGGAIAASAPPVYAAPAPVYVEPAPVYVEPAPVYVEPAPRPVYYAPRRPVVVEQRCWVERSRDWVPGWGWQYHRQTVCR